MGDMIPIKGKCPFCGHGDTHSRNWCIYVPSNDGYQYLLCMRAWCTEVEANNPGMSRDYGTRLRGADGQTWISYGEVRSGEGYRLLPENDARQKARDRAVNRQAEYVNWCKANNKNPRHDYVAEFEESWRNGTYSFTANNSSASTNPPPTKTPKTYFSTVKVDEKKYVRKDKELDAVYKSLLNHLVLEDADKEYLLNEGWSEDMIQKSGIKSFPEADLLRNKFKRANPNPSRRELYSIVCKDLGVKDLYGVPGACESSTGSGTFTGYSGLIIPTPNIKGEWYRVRIRRNYRDVDGEVRRDFKGRYFVNEAGEKIYFSHKGFFKLDEDGISRKIKDDGKYRNFASGWKPHGTDAGNMCGFYYDSRADEPYIWFITEGEKKAMYAEMKINKPHISLPGVNSWALLLRRDESGKCPAEILREMGVQVLVSAFDADKHSNGQVMAMEENLVSCQELKELGFIMGKAFWDGSLGKGEDDFLATGGSLQFE